MGIIETIQKFAKNDVELTRLFESAREYAELYIIAKQRQKGCDGMGEVATLKDDLVYSLNEMIRYCKENSFFSGDVPNDIELIARDISKRKPE